MSGSGLRRRWTLVAAVVVLVAPPPAAARSAPPTLVLLGSDTLSVAAKQHAKTTTAFVSILNKGKATASIKVAFAASTAAGVSVDPIPQPALIKGGDAQRVKVRFRGLTTLTSSVDGELVVRGGAAPIAKSVSITPAPQPAHLWARDIVFGSLTIGAIGFLLTALWITRSGRKPTGGTLSTRAPGPKWAFDSSWATNLTTVGAAFGTVLGAATLSNVPSQIDKETLVRLNLGFGLLVVAAPFLFHAIRKPSRSSAMDDNGLYGWNITLLLASCLTFAAVLGELATLALLFWELLGGGGYSWIAVGATSAAGLLAMLYYLATVPFVASTDWPSLVKEQQDSQQLSRISDVLGWLEREKSELAGSVGLPRAEDVEEAVRATEAAPHVLTMAAAPVRWRLP
jgi:hypothetical protein